MEGVFGSPRSPARVYLLPGEYTVAFNAPAGVTATFDPASIAVSLGSGESETAAAVVTAAE